MKTIKKTNQVVALVMIAATLMFAASCKKENLNEPTSLSASDNQNVVNKLSSPWQMKSSGISVAQRGIVEMSEPDQTTCYGVIFDALGVDPLHDITITHDGGATWHSQT